MSFAWLQKGLKGRGNKGNEEKISVTAIGTFLWRERATKNNCREERVFLVISCMFYIG